MALAAAIALRSMHGIWTRPPIGSQVRPEVVFHCDFRGVFHLLGRAAHDLGQSCCGHRRRRAHLALAADFGAGDRGLFLVQHTDGSGGQQELHDRLVAVLLGGLVHAGGEVQRIVEDGGDDAGGPVRGGGDDAAAGSVFLVHGERDQVDPLLPVLRVPVVGVLAAGFLHEALMPVGCAAADLEPAGQQAHAFEADLHAALHDGVDVQEAFADLRFGAGRALVDEHDLAD